QSAHVGEHGLARWNQMQKVESKRCIELGVTPGRRFRRRYSEFNICFAFSLRLLAPDRDHLRRNVACDHTRHRRRELERCGARAATELDHCIRGLEIMASALKRTLVAGCI